MINKTEISVGSLIQLSNGDILRVRSIDTARDIVALEYESRAAGDLPPAESASHLRLNAPNLPPAGSREKGSRTESGAARAGCILQMGRFSECCQARIKVSSRFVMA